jgi:hypothetical protein
MHGTWLPQELNRFFRLFYAGQKRTHHGSTIASSRISLGCKRMMLLLIDQVYAHPLFLFPMHLGRDFEPQSLQANETGGVVLVVGFGRVGFHGGDLRPERFRP